MGAVTGSHIRFVLAVKGVGCGGLFFRKRLQPWVTCAGGQAPRGSGSIECGGCVGAVKCSETGVGCRVGCIDAVAGLMGGVAGMVKIAFAFLTLGLIAHLLCAAIRSRSKTKIENIDVIDLPGGVAVDDVDGQSRFERLGAFNLWAH